MKCIARLAFLASLGVAALVTACASKPVVPDWQLNAQGALDRYVKSYMAGNTRVETAEFERALGELRSTGEAGLVARAELTRCAVQVASLVLDPCTGFDRLRADAPPAERAYADFLAGRLAPPDAALLPPQYRAVAEGGEAALQAIADPLSREIAAGVLFRGGRASPQVLELAASTASQQGWRRPLLAWLGVQAQRAESGGAIEEAQRIRRRIALVTESK